MCYNKLSPQQQGASIMNLQVKHIVNDLESSTAEQGCLRYRLLRLCGKENALFWVCVEYGSERAMGRLPTNDACSARGLFDRIIKGRVTPCALSDIIEDMS